VLDLTALIAAVAADSDAPDPHTLAQQVLDSIQPADYADALLQALPGVIRQHLQRQRAEAAATFPIPATDTNPGPGLRPSGSRKVSAIRDAWQARLRERVYIPGSDSGWKFLADCTAVDLLAVAEARRAHAERTLARAEEYEALADALRQSRKKTVGALSQESLRSLLAPAA
jgi:hypothetical protein